MSAEKKGEFDSRRFICAPYNGKRGPAYTRRFRPDFIGALHSQADRFATIHNHWARVDPGAQPADPTLTRIPHPGAANSNLRAESEIAYIARSKKLYALIVR